MDKREAIIEMRKHLDDAEFIRRAEADCRTIARQVIEWRRENMQPMHDDVWVYVKKELDDDSDFSTAIEYLLEKAKADDLFADDSWAEIGDQIADKKWDSYGDMITEVGARAFDAIEPYSQADFDRQMRAWAEEREYENYAYERDCC